MEKSFNTKENKKNVGKTIGLVALALLCAVFTVVIISL